MPVFEFDEFENSRPGPEPGTTLYNYWGYSTVNFFSPKAGFAASGPLGMQVDELKTTIKELHRAGIEVILDVVFNHTAEGNENGPTLSFRGIDNQTYYMLTPDGGYFNFSGCGNTLNCNNPVVRGLVLDCLRYWAAEYHIDGFRFDLASILGRDPWGAPMSNPPLLEALAFDPILGKCKLIAEAWDAGGLYQVGSFPAFGRWAEWNGKYRDDIRRFLKGDDGLIGAVAQRLRGSPDLYGWNRRGPTASVNFITCHDGFTLHDLFSYDGKHNEGNGENNRDGANDNHSWNCGAEGETTDERHQCPAPPPHQVRLDRAAGQPGRADGADGRRSRAQPEGQQQYLLPGQRAELVGLDPGGARVRPVAFRPHDDRTAQGASGPPSGAAPDRTASCAAASMPTSPGMARVPGTPIGRPEAGR